MAALEETVGQEYAEDDTLKDIDVEIETLRKYVSTFGFDVKTNETDLVFIVEGERLYVSSVVIKLSSTVFAELVENSERNESGTYEIEIHDRACKHFVDFLACFYPGKCHQLSDESVFRILPLAYQYNLQLVKCNCEIYILNAIKSHETAQDMLSKCASAAYEFNMQAMKQAALERIVNKQKDNLKVVVEPLPTNDAARVDFYEAILPGLISDENKLAFLMAMIPKMAGLDMSCFHNPLLRSMELQCKFEKQKTSIANETIEPLGFSVKVETSATFNKTANVKFSLSDLNSNGNVVVLYTLHSKKKDTRDLGEFKQFKLDAHGNNTNTCILSQVSITLDTREEAAFVLEGMFTVSIHVLFDKPT